MFHGPKRVCIRRLITLSKGEAAEAARRRSAARELLGNSVANQHSIAAKPRRPI